MNLILRIPDDLADRLGTMGELERRALEIFALEEFRFGRLNKADLRRLLGLATAAETESFLAAHAFEQDNVMPDEGARARAQQAVENILARRRGVRLGGLEIKTLVGEGRP